MKRLSIPFIVCFGLTGCGAPVYQMTSSVPAKEYASGVRAQLNLRAEDQIVGEQGFSRATSFPGQAPQVQFAKDLPPEMRQRQNQQGIVSNMQPDGTLGAEPLFQEFHNEQPNTRPYIGSLTAGNPGVEASLYQEARAANDLFRDHRAYRPMDLITILINETIDASTEADTEVTQESSILSGITNFLNFELDVESSNTGLDTATLIDADNTSEYTGEGDTTRSSAFTATMSAMIVEVLPSGVMRIEGKRIITLNNEEQTMVITGLVRPRDVNSRNEVQSRSIANLRVDFFGNGVVADVQHGGSVGNFLRRWWPF